MCSKEKCGQNVTKANVLNVSVAVTSLNDDYDRALKLRRTFTARGQKLLSSLEIRAKAVTH